MQWRNQDFPDGGHQPKGGKHQLIVGLNSALKLHKIRKSGLEGARVPAPSESANEMYKSSYVPRQLDILDTGLSPGHSRIRKSKTQKEFPYMRVRSENPDVFKSYQLKKNVQNVFTENPINVHIELR